MIDLVGIRREQGLTQTQLATALGTTQGQVSRLEKQNDMLVSTLTAYLTALGVEAKLIVEIEGRPARTYDLAWHPITGHR